MKRIVLRSSLLVATLSALASLAACSSGNVANEEAEADLAPQPPVVRSTSHPLVVRAGDSAMFTVSAESTQPVKYQWQRDGVDIVGASENRLVIAAAAESDDKGRYSVRVSNPGGEVAVEAGELLVIGYEVPLMWE